MWNVRTIGLIVTVLSVPASVFAQSGKYCAAVIIPDMQMRAGNSFQYPQTGKLKKGEQVIVHHEDEDKKWVAIIPPVGSVSWVNHRFLGEFDANATGKQNAMIMADHVEIRVGGETGGPLNVTQVKLPKGSLVEIIGTKFQDDSKSWWYPITPPEGEYRWLPKEALGPPTALQPPSVFVKSGSVPAMPPPGSDVTPGTLTSMAPKPTSVQHSLFDKAEQAERTGDYATAEKLYRMCYQELRQKNGDQEQLLVCYSRLIRCQDRLKLEGTTTPPTQPQPQPQFVASPDSGNRPATSLLPPTGASVGLTGSAWPPTAPAATNGQRTSGPGSLRRAPFNIDGKQAYALENTYGQVLFYVTASNNTVRLDLYINRQVELFGTVVPRGDVRGAQYMAVTLINAK